jgi:hypothetical protein
MPVIRISDEVAAQLAARKGPKRGWDPFLRRFLGIPARNGTAQPLLEMWVLPRSGLAYPNKAKALGGAIMESVRTGNEKERPVRMRETV